MEMNTFRAHLIKYKIKEILNFRKPHIYYKKKKKKKKKKFNCLQTYTRASITNKYIPTIVL